MPDFTLVYDDFDPAQEVKASREELLGAAFTILIAWRRVRELPENKPFRRPLGSFEQWADLVAGAVAWLTGENPIDLIEDTFFFGTPEQMRERLDAYVAGGITLPIITPITTPDKLGGMIEALAP